jgi:hypothetical protein
VTLCSLALGYAAPHGLGRHIEAVSDEDLLTFRRGDYIFSHFYNIGIGLTKLAVLALYYRIFSINRTYRLSIYALAAAQAVLIFLCCVLQSQICHPFARWFDRTIPGTCKSDGLIILAGETPNSIIDFLMVILAMVMIRSLHLSRIVKWRLRFLFGLGALVGIVGFIKVALTFSMADVYSLSMVSLLSCIQMFLSLLCCCLPVYQSILPSAARWNRMSAKVLSYASFGRISFNKSATRSADRSSRRGPQDSNSKNSHRWEYLDEQRNTGGLAWPEASHQAEAHSLQDFSPPSYRRHDSGGIRVERQFVISSAGDASEGGKATIK